MWLYLCFCIFDEAALQSKLSSLLSFSSKYVCLNCLVFTLLWEFLFSVVLGSLHVFYLKRSFLKKIQFEFAGLGKCVAMKEEIAAAVFFLARLVKRYGCLDNDSRERFAASLTSLLFENYKNHWHPSTPARGQAYRSVIKSKCFWSS